MKTTSRSEVVVACDHAPFCHAWLPTFRVLGTFLSPLEDAWLPLCCRGYAASDSSVGRTGA